MNPDWGSKEWFDYNFTDIDHDELGDRWGHRWRGSQHIRFQIYNNLLKGILPSQEQLRILDIGCALGDFTTQVMKMDPKNRMMGIDISPIAIRRFSASSQGHLEPALELGTGKLPDLPFKKDTIDLVLCLEVIYYLDQKARERSLEDISRILDPQGKVLISGVLDGGVQYFNEARLIELVSRFFIIEKIDYNYAKIYTVFESRLLHLLNALNGMDHLLEKSEKEFLSWSRNNSQKRRAKIAKGIRRITNPLPRGNVMAHSMISLLESIIRGMLSLRFPVSFSFMLTKIFLGNRGKTTIILLARSK